MLWAFPAPADPIAIEAHCMGFSVPAPSSLRKSPGHTACLAWSARDGVAEGGASGGKCWRLNDETAARVDDGRALRAISLFSTRAMTSFPGSEEYSWSQELHSGCLDRISH